MEKLKPGVWDYYDEKLLRSLVIQYSFDFTEIASFYQRNFKNKPFSERDCRVKWKEMNQTQNENESRFSEICKGLTEKRTANDFLKVSKEDLTKEKTELEDGTKIFPNGMSNI